MIRHDAGRPLEPERRQLSENLAFVRDARPQDVIEGRDAIGRDHHQGVAAIEEVANLALPVRSKTIQARFDQGSGEWQRGGPGPSTSLGTTLSLSKGARER